MTTVMPIGKADAQSAGTVGAVNKDATGTPPGRASKPLEIGQGVTQNERLQTDANGTAQIIFNDRSALNLGRNSTVVVDNFVYNPGAGAGTMALSLSRGTARFVGGEVSHSSGAIVRTPIASIGIRGGNMTVQHGSGGTTIMVHNGVAAVTNSFGTQSVRTGFQLTVIAGVPLGTPVPINMQLLRAFSSQLASQGSQTGGAVNRPNDGQAVRNRIGTPRAPVRTPGFDLPAAGDDVLRGLTTTRNQKAYP